jgi:hypothetical protein
VSRSASASGSPNVALVRAASIESYLGRAALKRTHKWQELNEVPHLFGFLRAEEKRGRDPIGRPVSPREIARLMDAARSRHMLAFLVIGSNTLARPAAILDVRPARSIRSTICSTSIRRAVG